jgi:hypothetical protein
MTVGIRIGGATAFALASAAKLDGGHEDSWWPLFTAHVTHSLQSVP